MRLLVNLTLSLLLVAILTLPVVAGHLMISPPRESGAVAGAASVSEREVNIIPNLQDFDGHVSFSPGPIRDGQYQDTLGLRVFQRQKASYHGLYTLYNLSEDRSLAIEVVTPGVAGGPEVVFERVVLSISQGQPAQALRRDVERGATVLELEDPAAFQAGERLLIGSESVTVVVVSPDGVVVTPLLSDHARNESVYPEAIVLTSEKLVNPRTRTLVLTPGEKAIVSAVVEGAADLVAGDGMFSLPLIFNIRPAVF